MHKVNNFIQSRYINLEDKKAIALESLKGKSISSISRDYNCSRNTVYKQQSIIIQATDTAFMAKQDGVLFYIAITENFIFSIVVALFTMCKASYRDIKLFMQAVFGYEMALGTVWNIINNAAAMANEVNKSHDLSLVKKASSDEMFQNGEAILTTVDIPSRYCTQALKVNDVDGETWAIAILEMVDQGFNPELVITDGAGGISKGYSEVLPGIKIRYDHFHIILDTKKCKGSLNQAINSLMGQIAKLIPDSKEVTRRIHSLNELIKIRETFNILTGWLQHDVLQLAGPTPEIRTRLFDFIVDELKKLPYVKAVAKIIKSLQFQRDRLLDVAHHLNNEFEKIAAQFKLPVSIIWKICYLTRYDYESFKYQTKSEQLELITGDCYDEIENAILLVLENTYRTSAIVENLNGRLRPYLVANKAFKQPALDLIRCYQNHKPFMRSYYQRLKGKTPTEILTGKKHRPFLQLLGFDPVIKLAA